MWYRFLADILVLLHIGFVVFAVAGGLLALRWQFVIWWHLPAACWAVFVQTSRGYCPLTSWENRLRVLGGQAGYQASFVDHYLLPILYPPGLTRELEVLLGIVVLVINIGVYGWLLRRLRSARL
ncbi:MAG: DUF2784 domain-containing protein [Pseudomonadota bacterium]